MSGPTPVTTAEPASKPALLRILIADDHEIARRGLRALLETQAGWQICGEAANGREAVEKARELKPDIVILDITMPQLNGLDATRQILKTISDIQILILTMHDSEDLVREVIEAGARGYVLKSDAGQDLVAAIDALRRKQTFLTPRVSGIVLEAYLKHREGEPGRETTPGRLTAREREVVQLVAEGKSNKEVAAALGISVKTAEAHRARVKRKLGLHSSSELVRYAVRNRIVEA